MKHNSIVVALIYSGRPDPRWELTEEQAEHFISLWNEAPYSEVKISIPAVSGYKGLRLLLDEKQFFIYNGLITQIENKTSKNDQQRRIEKFLLATAPEQMMELLKNLNIL